MDILKTEIVGNQNHRRKQTFQKKEGLDTCKKLCKSGNEIQNYQVEQKANKISTKIEICEEGCETTSEEDNIPVAIESDNCFKCNTCGESFVQEHFLKQHNWTVHGHGKEFKCDTCGKSFDKQHFLKRHLAVVHNGDSGVKCDICAKIFLNEAAVTNHRKRAHVEYQFKKCESCGIKFSDSFKLERHHKRVHEGASLTCPVCGKGFSKSTYLKMHKRMHLSEEIECDICGKRFRSCLKLGRHLSLHNEQTWLPCDICKKLFPSVTELKIHENTHLKILKMKPLDCQKSGKHFQKADDLHTHKLVHIEEEFEFETVNAINSSEVQ